MSSSPNPVLLELASLPREQSGPFLLLGVEKEASKEDIEASWAERIKWARKGVINVSLEDINWAREILSDPERRVLADVGSINADTVEGLIEQLTEQFLPGRRSGQPAWEPLEQAEPSLLDHVPALEIPDPAQMRASLALPALPPEFPLLGVFLQQLAQTPLDPWSQEW